MSKSKKPKATVIAPVTAPAAKPAMPEPGEVEATLRARGITKIPEGIEWMFAAWEGCVSWAASREDVRASFKADTGLSLESLSNRSPLDTAIDEATGYEKKVLAAFCDYVTEHIWCE